MKLTIAILGLALAVTTSQAATMNQLKTSMNPVLDTGALSSLNSQISGQVSSLQSSLNSQTPIGSAISLADATSLFSSQVQPGNMNFPLIQMAQYLIYEIGPPWASTTGWYVGEDYIENPLYDTEMAEYIRGLEDSSGESSQAQNIVENTMKASSQKSQAINDIMDKANKDATLKALEKQYAAYGNSSQTVHSTQVGSTVSNSLPVYTNTFDAVPHGAMAGVLQSRKDSAALDTQLQNDYTRINEHQTLLQRAAIKNEQEMTKTAVLQQLAGTINNKTVMHAMERNQDLQKTNNENQLKESLSQGAVLE